MHKNTYTTNDLLVKETLQDFINDFELVDTWKKINPDDETRPGHMFLPKNDGHQASRIDYVLHSRRLVETGLDLNMVHLDRTTYKMDHLPTLTTLMVGVPRKSTTQRLE